MATKTETPEEKQDRETVEGIAKNLERLANSVASLLRGPLNRKALVTLLARSSKLPPAQVGNVLDSLENLKKDWLK